MAREFLNIDAIMKDYCQSRNWDGKIIYSNILDIWSIALGEKIVHKVKIEKFEDAIIYISTESSVWKTELSLRKGSIIAFLNNHLANDHGKDCIKDIIIH